MVDDGSRIPTQPCAKNKHLEKIILMGTKSQSNSCLAPGSAVLVAEWTGPQPTAWRVRHEGCCGLGTSRMTPLEAFPEYPALSLALSLGGVKLACLDRV